jgi:hypothetical protein
MSMTNDIKPAPLKFVYDDGGRAEAGFKGEAGDCVTRAVAIATGLPYGRVYEALADGMATSSGKHYSRGQRSARNGVFRDVYQSYLAELGWQWTPTMKIGSGCTVHLAKGELPGGNLVARLSRHVVAVVDGVVHDTHDPTRGGTRCVYGYFAKEGGDS